MRWDYRFTEIQEEVKRVSAKADALAEAYAEAEDFTLRFLKQCSKHKVKLVSIGTRTDLIESSKTFPFGCSGSVFAEGRDSFDWPVIWRIVEELGISGGAGNSGQHQVNCDAKLVDGVYKFENKTWHKIG